MDYDNSKIEGCPLIVINDDLVSIFCGKIKFFAHKRQTDKNLTTSGLLFLVDFEIFEQTLNDGQNMRTNEKWRHRNNFEKADKLSRQIRN